jgi:hypothetical protein
VTLRGRLTLVAAGVVAVVVALSATATYFLMRHELYAQVDTSLTNDAKLVDPNNPVVPEGFPGNLVEFFDSRGVALPNRTIAVPYDASMREVVAGRKGAFFQNATVPRVR